jgi:hypothetical protein
MKVLKKKSFNFKATDQVRQLITSISVKGRMVREKAEEVLCLILKSNASLGMYHKLAVKGCNLFSCELDSQQKPYIRHLNYMSKMQLPLVQRAGFTDSLDSHYYPPWDKFCDLLKYSFNYARMTLKLNIIFNIKPKTTVTQIQDLEKEKVHFAADDVEFSAT